MIISKRYAERLIRDGDAKIESELTPDYYGRVYVAITRYDLQRTDHYLRDPTRYSRRRLNLHRHKPTQEHQHHAIPSNPKIR